MTSEHTEDPADDELPGSPRVGLAIIGGLGLGLLGSSFAFARVGGRAGEGTELTGAEEFAVALPLLLGLAGGALVACGIGGRSPWRPLGLHRFDGRGITAGLAVGVVLQGLVVLIEVVITAIFGEGADSARDLVAPFDSTGERVLLVVLVVLLAPLCEELFYRGALIPLVQRRFRPAWSVVAVAALFALSHLNGRQLLGLFVVGVVLGWLRVARRSVAPAIAAHLAFNAAGLSLLALDGGW